MGNRTDTRRLFTWVRIPLPELMAISRRCWFFHLSCMSCVLCLLLAFGGIVRFDLLCFECVVPSLDVTMQI